jgi:hypothetical protein
VLGKLIQKLVLSRLRPDRSAQVPDYFVDILNDPALFSNNGDITTKEILKRFGDRNMNNGARSYNDVSEVVNRHDFGVRPMARRVETDPSLWQDERTVRPMQDPPAIPHTGSNQNTPPPKFRGGLEEGQPSPYAQEFEAPGAGHPDDRNPRREWRNSGWGRGNSSVGVTGT